MAPRLSAGPFPILSTRSNENLTALASSGVPSSNLIPFRILMVHELGRRADERLGAGAPRGPRDAGGCGGARPAALSAAGEPDRVLPRAARRLPLLHRFG